MHTSIVAQLITVQYPSGEQVIATGYVGGTLVAQIIPRGPEAQLLDVLEIDYTGPEPFRVVRVIGGPRRPTIRVRLEVDEPVAEAWIDAREADGWTARCAEPSAASPEQHGSTEVWVVAMRDGLDPAALVAAGATIVT